MRESRQLYTSGMVIPLTQCQRCECYYYDDGDGIIGTLTDESCSAVLQQQGIVCEPLPLSSASFSDIHVHTHTGVWPVLVAASYAQRTVSFITLLIVRPSHYHFHCHCYHITATLLLSIYSQHDSHHKPSVCHCYGTSFTHNHITITITPRPLPSP